MRGLSVLPNDTLVSRTWDRTGSPLMGGCPCSPLTHSWPSTKCISPRFLTASTGDRGVSFRGGVIWGLNYDIKDLRSTVWGPRRLPTFLRVTSAPCVSKSNERPQGFLPSVSLRTKRKRRAECEVVRTSSF